MAPVHLRTVTRTQGSNQALKDGSVTPQGFRFDFEEVPVLVHAFRRMVRGLEFDVCEMAFTTYLCAKAHGKPFTALPVFLVRGFHHGAIVHNPATGVRKPKDLEGRSVGVNRGYTVTTGVWARGILADEYGVDLNRVTWVRSGDEHVAAGAEPAQQPRQPNCSTQPEARSRPPKSRRNPTRRCSYRGASRVSRCGGEFSHAISALRAVPRLRLPQARFSPNAQLRVPEV